MNRRYNNSEFTILSNYEGISFSLEKISFEDFVQLQLKCTQVHNRNEMKMTILPCSRQFNIGLIKQNIQIKHENVEMLLSTSLNSLNTTTTVETIQS